MNQLRFINIDISILTKTLKILYNDGIKLGIIYQIEIKPFTQNTQQRSAFTKKGQVNWMLFKSDMVQESEETCTI